MESKVGREKSSWRKQRRRFRQQAAFRCRLDVRISLRPEIVLKVFRIRVKCQKVE